MNAVTPIAPPFSMREPPHNFEAEMALLGAIMVNNAAWSAASEMLQAEHFADPIHRRLYDALGRMIGRGQIVNVQVLRAFAEADDDLKSVGGWAYLARLMGSSVHVLDAPAAARTIRDCAIRRGLITVLTEAIPDAYDVAAEATAAETIEAVERRLYELADGAIEGGFRPFRASLTEAVKSAEAAHQKPDGMTGQTTGLRDLDKMLGGLNRSDLVILAARPGMGKSALASNIGFATAETGAVAGFFSLEMSAEQLATRIVAEQAGVPTERVKRGQLTGAEFDRVITASQRLEALPMFLDDTAAVTLQGIATRARRLKRAQGLALIIIDYLQLITTAGRRAENRVQEVSEISRGLKTLAKELDVPVLALSQLSRAVEQRSDKRPQLADLRESGSIEQDADVVMFIYREEYYLERGTEDDRARLASVAGKAELAIAKNRHGPTGLVHLRFDGPTTRFSDIDRSDR